ncbi:MAG: hypothetical protein HY928_16495 [Elusimicrobia bacterium]|nr:hypothetical protein [Elusimicrobiota bacterium]
MGKTASGLAVLALLAGAGCVTAPTTFEAASLRHEAEGRRFKTVAVLPMSEDPGLRKHFAESVVGFLRPWTVRAERGADLLPRQLYDADGDGRIDPAVDRDLIRLRLSEAGFEAVLTVAYQPKEDALPAAGAHQWPEASLPEYMTAQYEKARAAGAARPDELLLETNLYDSKTGKVVWSAHSRTTRSASATVLAESYAAAVVDELVKYGLIGKR